MKYIEEYRNATSAEKLIKEIRSAVTRVWTIMEICGGQTHTIVKSGIDDLLPTNLTLVHGPGCPVCVTPLELIDKAVALASRSDIIFTSFGDMLRVPGSEKDLLAVKAQGGDVRIVYSPLAVLILKDLKCYLRSERSQPDMAVYVRPCMCFRRLRGRISVQTSLM